MVIKLDVRPRKMTRDLFAVVNLLVLTWDFNQSECPPVVLWFCVDKIVYIQYIQHIS